MLVMVLHLNFIALLLASVVKEKGAQMPPLQDLGAFTKWMSDPPPKGPIKPPLQDKYHRYCRKYPDYYCGNLESLRVENRVNTLGKPSF